MFIMNFFKNNKGFTLIELLVVVAIIGVLSSVVLVSLKSAKDKVRLTQYKEGMNQFSKLLELEYLEKGSYSGLNTQSVTNWIASAADCDTDFGPSSGRTSQYLSNALALCKQIANASSGIYRLEIYSSGGAYTNPDKYSIDGWFDGASLYCFGSSGKSLPAGVGAYAELGCHGNP